MITFEKDDTGEGWGFGLIIARDGAVGVFWRWMIKAEWRKVVYEKGGTHERTL